MWFNNVYIYQFIEAKDVDTQTLQEKCHELRLKPCPPHSRSIYGWSPIYDQQYTHSVDGAHFLVLTKEERVLPQTVIKHELNEKVQALESAQGKPLKRAEIAHLKEELEFSLLPKAFCIQKRQWCYIDSVNKLLIVNTASANQGAQVCAMLRKTLGNITLSPLNVDHQIQSLLTDWLSTPANLPENFELAPNCILQAPDDDTKRFVCKGYELPADEICTLLEKQLEVCELSLIWSEQVKLSLTNDLIFKRLKCTDILQSELKDIEAEGEIDMLDANLTLMLGALRALIKDTLVAVNANTEEETVSPPEQNTSKNITETQSAVPWEEDALA